MIDLLEKRMNEKTTQALASNTCVLCKWGQATQILPASVHRARFCHRFPPQVMVVNGGISAAFPMVGDEAYCGEWQPLQSS